MRKGIILILLIASIFMFGCVQNERGKTLTEEEVKKFVLDDLNSKYPQADVREILEIRTTDSNESWQIKTRVTFNYTSPCPVRMSVYYDYPRKGFIETPPEYITKDCQVCKGVAKCILGTPEEAIIASHTLDGGEPVSKFIKDYPNAKASAKFYSEYIDPVEKRTHNNIWVVKWTTDATNYGLIVLITNDARIIGVIRATKQETI